MKKEYITTKSETVDMSSRNSILSGSGILNDYVNNTLVIDDVIIDVEFE